jgi:chromosome partitioning protein
MRRIAFINEKGGTCKTTLCVNIAAWLAGRRRLRVLVCDLDTQGHAGKSLGVDVRDLRPTMREWLDGAAPFEAVVKPTAVEGLELVPANKDLAGFPLAAAGDPGRERRLRDRLEEVAPGRYDLVLLDAPPSLSLVTENALRAAGEIVIPVALTYLALDGAAEILESLARLEAEGAAAPRVTMVVPALYRRTQLADEILAKLRERFPRELARTPLGWAVKIDEAQSHGMTIFEYAPGSSAARMLRALAEELLERDPSGAPPPPLPRRRGRARAPERKP